MKKKTLTLSEALKKGENLLRESKVPNARLDAFSLLSFTTQITRANYYLEPNKELTLAEEHAYWKRIKQRAKRIPLQHITGEQEFMGYTFKVNDKVLIPRQDTEVLVEEALSVLTGSEKILDMCTGSGCIIISLYKLLEEKGLKPEGSFTAVDISKEALKVARENAKRLEAKVTFIESNLFENITDKYDMIVSNPPYIQTKEIEALEAEVKLYDPALALDGGADGLDFYRQIIRDGKKYLNKDGYLLLEIGYDEAEEVMNLLKEENYSKIYMKKDLSGLDRIVGGQLQ